MQHNCSQRQKRPNKFRKTTSKIKALTHTLLHKRVYLEGGLPKPNKLATFTFHNDSK